MLLPILGAPTILLFARNTRSASCVHIHTRLCETSLARHRRISGRPTIKGETKWHRVGGGSIIIGHRLGCRQLFAISFLFFRVKPGLIRHDPKRTGKKPRQSLLVGCLAYTKPVCLSGIEQPWPAELVFATVCVAACPAIRLPLQLGGSR